VGFQWVRFPPGNLSLQPVAIGAIEEVTNRLKPSVQRVAIGDLAIVQAVTRVNAEQASKSSMRKPTRQWNGEGRRRWYPAWPGLLGKSDLIQRFRRGNGDGMHVDGDLTQHGKPDMAEGRDLQPDSREGQAGPCGVADRPVVPWKPGNAGGGKGPWFKVNAGSS